MGLPKQIARQAAEADRIVRNLNGADESPPPSDVPPPDTPPARQTAPVQPVATPAPQPPAAPPAAAPVAPVAPVAPAAPSPGNEWESRYHSLQGKYNAEVPALQNQLQNAMTAMGNMGRELDTLKAQVAQRSAQPPAPPPAERRVTDADITTWGADMLDVIGRKAAEEAQRMVQPLASENEQLKDVIAKLQGRTDQVAQTQQQNREQMFWTRLQEVVPNWQAMNTDPAFLGWLSEYDPMIGNTRKYALDQAQAQLNADRAGAFFRAYAATLPPPVAQNPQAELQRQVNPGQRRASETQGYAPPPGAQTVEIWTSQEVSDFYTDVTRGRYRSSPDEYSRMNDAITRAVAEGRVR
jgi:hypothetical protein